MPEWNSENTMTRRPGQLNESQKTRLRISCRYIDKLLGDIGIFSMPLIRNLLFGAISWTSAPSRSAF